MMATQTLSDWLLGGETDAVEFKTSFNQETIESLVAFANHKGGVVLLGVVSSQKVPGLSLAKESIQQWLNEIKSKTEPSLIPDADVF
jgi:ATP-dependent DNA helicase RecG